MQIRFGVLKKYSRELFIRAVIGSRASGGVGVGAVVKA